MVILANCHSGPYLAVFEQGGGGGGSRADVVSLASGEDLRAEMTLTRAFLSLFRISGGGGGNCPHSPSPLGTALSFFQQIFTRRVDNSKAIKAIATKIDSWLDLCKLIVFLPYVVTSQRYHIYVKLIFFSIFLRKVTTQNHNRAIAIEVTCIWLVLSKMIIFLL